MTGKLHSLVTGACLKRFERKGRHSSSCGCIPTNKRNGAPPYLLPARVIDCYQPGKRDKRSMSFLDDSNSCLSLGELLDNRAEAHKTKVQAAQLSLVNDQLYKLFLDRPYLKYLTHQQGQYVLAKLHDGVCLNHPSSRTLVLTIFFI